MNCACWKPLPYGRGFHEKAGLCQDIFSCLTFAISSGPTDGEAGCCRVPKAPFPSSQLSLRNGGNLSRARGLCAACEPLTDSLRSGTWIPRERGPGSQGACPLAEYEAAPHARRQARPPRGSFLVLCLCRCRSDCLLSIDSSATVAMLPSAL